MRPEFSNSWKKKFLVFTGGGSELLRSHAKMFFLGEKFQNLFFFQIFLCKNILHFFFSTFFPKTLFFTTLNVFFGNSFFFCLFFKLTFNKFYLTFYWFFCFYFFLHNKFLFDILTCYWIFFRIFFVQKTTKLVTFLYHFLWIEYYPLSRLRVPSSLTLIHQ
jgi:hypothetical protein